MQHIAKKLLVGTTFAALMSLGLTIPALASGSPVVGNWSVVDHGQGCWGGGNLLADGSAGGGGNCSFSTGTGQEVATLKPVSWNFTDATDTSVNLCASITGKKGDVFPIGVPVPTCIVVPVGTDAPVDLGGGTFGKVTIH